MQGPMASDSTVFTSEETEVPEQSWPRAGPKEIRDREALFSQPPTHEPLGPSFWIPSRIFCYGCHSGCVQTALQKLIRTC